MAMRVDGSNVHVNCKVPSTSNAQQVELTVSTVSVAEGNARGNHDSKSAAVQPITRSKLSGTKTGVIGRAIQQH